MNAVDAHRASKNKIVGSKALPTDGLYRNKARGDAISVFGWRWPVGAWRKQEFVDEGSRVSEAVDHQNGWEAGPSRNPGGAHVTTSASRPPIFKAQNNSPKKGQQSISTDTPHPQRDKSCGRYSPC